jgi:hypothetical protein
MNAHNHHQIALPGIAEEEPPAKPAPQTSTRFNWDHEDCVVVAEQPAIAVYRNTRDHVVIRSQALDPFDEDAFVFVTSPDALKVLIAALERELQAW